MLLSIGLGLGAGPAIDYSRLAAEQLLDTAGLVHDVCGPGGCDTAVLSAAR